MQGCCIFHWNCDAIIEPIRKTDWWLWCFRWATWRCWRTARAPWWTSTCRTPAPWGPRELPSLRWDTPRPASPATLGLHIIPERWLSDLSRPMPAVQTSWHYNINLIVEYLLSLQIVKNNNNSNICCYYFWFFKFQESSSSNFGKAYCFPYFYKNIK